MGYEPETVWSFGMVRGVQFGVGAASELPWLMGEFDASTALLISDPGVNDAGIIDELVDPVEIDVTVFAEVEPDPSIETFERAVETATTVDPEVIIGVGGGSSMDVAKTTSIIHRHGGELMDYVAPPTGKGNAVPASGTPTICVPTTAGTGSETSPVSVISLPERDMKVGISSDMQVPDRALIDPALTVTLPPGPTAASGMDALSHAIEAYVTRRYDTKPAPDTPDERPDYGGRTTLTDTLARTAIELIGSNLRRAVDNGMDLEARRAMALGSFLAGAAFTNAGLGAAHAMAMATGARHHTPHGETIAAVLPTVIRYNASTSQERFSEVANLLGESTDNLSKSDAANRAADAVESLSSDIGLPQGLGDLGVDREDIEPLASNASRLERLVVGNPRRISDNDMVGLFERAL